MLVEIRGWRWCKSLDSTLNWSIPATKTAKPLCRLMNKFHHTAASPEPLRRTAASTRRTRPLWWQAFWPLFVLVSFQAFPCVILSSENIQANNLYVSKTDWWIHHCYYNNFIQIARARMGLQWPSHIPSLVAVRAPVLLFQVQIRPWI